MPDQATGAICIADEPFVACRPAVTTCYLGSLKSIDEWWLAWKKFMFKDVLNVKINGEIKCTRPCELLRKISKIQNPTLAKQEERVSVPLQTLCQAIYDALIMYITVVISPKGQWQQIKRCIVDAVYSKKDAKTMAILRHNCAGVDVICLQECSAVFQASLLQNFGKEYHIAAPRDRDSAQSQSCLVMLRKETFPGGVYADLTKETLGEDTECGGLLVLAAEHKAGKRVLVASFCGDAVMPVVRAVTRGKSVLADQPEGCELFFGMSGSMCLEKRNGDQPSVSRFLSHCESCGLQSCWRQHMGIAVRHTVHTATCSHN
jgi:hypothetical protein